MIELCDGPEKSSMRGILWESIRPTSRKNGRMVTQIRQSCRSDSYKIKTLGNEYSRAFLLRNSPSARFGLIDKCNHNDYSSLTN